MSIDWLDPATPVSRASASDATEYRVRANASCRANLGHHEPAVHYDQLQVRSCTVSREKPFDPTERGLNSLPPGWYGGGENWSTVSNLAVAPRAWQVPPSAEVIAPQDETTARLYEELARTREEMQVIRMLLEQQTLREQASPRGGRWWHFWR